MSQERRLVAEGLVIVVSILFAFGIDASWAQRLERIEERESLASLQTEFEMNRAAIRQVIAMHLQFRATIEEFFELSESELLELPQLRVSQIALAAANPWTFDAVLGTTDALANTGGLAVLRDPQLRESLSTFQNLIADLGEDVAYISSSAEAVWEREAELGGPWTDPATEVSTSGPIEGLSFIPLATPDDLIRLARDVRYTGLVRRYHLNVAYYVRELERLDAHMERVLALIENQTVGAF